VRVAHITRDYPPRGNGGLSTAVSGLVRALREVDVSSTVVSFDSWRPKKSSSHGVQPAVRDGNVVRLSSPTQLESGLALAAESDADVVHVHHSMLWDFAGELKSRLSCPSVFTVHVAQQKQSELRGLEEPTLSERAQVRAINEADAVTAPSRSVASWLREHHDNVGERLHTIGLGTYAGPAVPRSGGPVVYVGRFADINGTAELVEALATVAAERKETRFEIAGGCPENPRAQRRWNERLREAIGDDRLTLHGWVAWPELVELYRRAAVVVIPSWFETFGQVAAEAMAFGAPIVATNVGALAEHLAHEVTALMSPARDVPALVGNISRILDQPELAEIIARRGAEEAGRLFDWPQKACDYRDLYAALKSAS
jgi:glycosyltransferase involved in cell wall biosynthesis